MVSVAELAMPQPGIPPDLAEHCIAAPIEHADRFSRLGSGAVLRMPARSPLHAVGLLLRSVAKLGVALNPDRRAKRRRLERFMTLQEVVHRLAEIVCVRLAKHRLIQVHLGEPFP